MKLTSTEPQHSMNYAHNFLIYTVKNKKVIRNWLWFMTVYSIDVRERQCNMISYFNCYDSVSYNQRNTSFLLAETQKMYATELMKGYDGA